MDKIAQHRISNRIIGLFFALGVLFVFGGGAKPALAQSGLSDQVFIPIVTNLSSASEVNLVFDLDAPTNEQMNTLASAVEQRGLQVDYVPGELTFYYDSNGERRTVLQLTCTTKRCAKDASQSISAADPQSPDGLKITISVEGEPKAIVEQVSRRLVTVTFLKNNLVDKIMEFHCRQCEINIDIPAADGEATPTPAPEPSSTPTPTDTATPPPAGEAANYWHAPGTHDSLNVHEHGDAPPAWADEFSIANFGHPVMFGGDEGTPNENAMKHQAYKGFAMRASDVDLYIRHHSQSNPHGRSAPLHSYEVYARDSSGNVSFWQGWQFYGYPEVRSQRMTRRHEVPGDGFPGRDQFIIAAPDRVDWDNNLRCEQWYGHGGLWSWDVSITICNASTLFNYDEHLTDIKDMSTWETTGAVGNGRRLEATHYGPSNPRVAGEDLPFGEWFCAKLKPNENRAAGAIPTWSLTGAVSGPDACPAGYLPQFVANTFPKKGVYFETGNTADKSFPAPGVMLPN